MNYLNTHLRKKTFGKKIKNVENIKNAKNTKRKKNEKKNIVAGVVVVDVVVVERFLY